MDDTTEKPPLLRIFGQPKMATLLVLGFSSGLPFYLTSKTLQAHDDGQSRSGHDRILQPRHTAILAQVRLGAAHGPLHPALPRPSAWLGVHHSAAADPCDCSDGAA